MGKNSARDRADTLKEWLQYIKYQRKLKKQLQRYEESNKSLD